MCSKTIFSPGKSRRSGCSTRSMNTASRSNRSIVGIGDLAVHQQQQAFALHRLQRGVGLADVGDAGIAVGGGTGRVQLAAPRCRPRARGASRRAACGRSGTASSAARSPRLRAARRGCAAVVQRHARWSSPAASGSASRWPARTAAPCAAAPRAARRRRAGAGASRRGGSATESIAWRHCGSRRRPPPRFAGGPQLSAAASSL